MLKKAFFTLIILLLCFFCLETFSLTALYFLKRFKGITYTSRVWRLDEKQRESVEKLLANNNEYSSFSKELGWSIKPNGHRGIYQANSQGLRANRDYELMPAKGKVRIATFGDSFTHGDEVSNDDTWQNFLEKRDDRFEVINFGVGGYGVDQAYLRYLKEGGGTILI